MPRIETENSGQNHCCRTTSTYNLGWTDYIGGFPGKDSWASLGKSLQLSMLRQRAALVNAHRDKLYFRRRLHAAFADKRTLCCYYACARLCRYQFFWLVITAADWRRIFIVPSLLLLHPFQRSHWHLWLPDFACSARNKPVPLLLGFATPVFFTRPLILPSNAAAGSFVSIYEAHWLEDSTSRTRLQTLPIQVQTRASVRSCILRSSVSGLHELWNPVAFWVAPY